MTAPPQQATNVGTTTLDQPPRPSDNRSFFGHPRGLAVLFTTEMWERFSFYGIRPLLILFMTAALAEGGFGFERNAASAIVGIYASSVYLSSLPGGWIADRLLGLRRAIFWGAVLISAGHISIGLSALAHGRAAFFIGLVLIVLGTGLLKPNISAIVGDLYPEGGARRDAGFSVFYMGINLGAFAGQIVTGLLGEKYGWHLGFGAAGVGMLLGLFTYSYFARRTLGTLGVERARHPDPATDARQLRLGTMLTAAGLAVLAVVILLATVGVIHLDPEAIAKSMTYVLVAIAVLYFGALVAFGGLTGSEKKRLAVIFVLFAFSAIFWAAFEQAPTSLNLFAKDFTDRTIAGWQVPALWFQSINSLFIIVLASVFAGIWTGLARRGVDLSSPTKFSLGLLFAGIGFAVMIPAANFILANNGAVKVSAWWLTISYFFQTIGELCLSPVGLSSMTKLSPRKYVGQMMGIWFLGTSVGNLIAGLVGGHVDPEKLEQMPQLFTGTTLALVGAAVLIALLIVPIRRMMATTTAAA
ncbi:MAG: peptide MFS transporter [Gemmatimonadaceae bacterium]|nr:peptide MFS transporter [Gemmatimonadaceae bacterium]